MAKGGETAVRVPRSGTSSVTTKVTEGSTSEMSPGYKRAGANVKQTTLPKGGRPKGKK